MTEFWFRQHCSRILCCVCIHYIHVHMCASMHQYVCILSAHWEWSHIYVYIYNRTIRRENLSARLLFTKNHLWLCVPYPLNFNEIWFLVVCLTVCDAYCVMVIFFSVCPHVAGLTAVLVTYPLDVLRSRVAFQVKAASVEVGMREMVRLMRSTEGGMKPFYRGMVPSVLGMAPYSGECMWKKNSTKKAQWC